MQRKTPTAGQNNAAQPLVAFLNTLAQTKESEKLLFIARSVQNRKLALANPMSTMTKLTVENRRKFADTYVNQKNFVSLAQALQFAEQRSAFIHSHLDLITADNLAPLADILEFSNRYQFYVNHSSHITADNIYFIAASLDPVSFGKLLSVNVDKINQDNFPALLRQLSLSGLSLTDHIHFLDSVVPVLTKTQHQIDTEKFMRLQNELKDKIKANNNGKGMLVINTSNEYTRKTPLQLLNEMLETAKSILRWQPFSEAERGILQKTGELPMEVDNRPMPLVTMIQGVSAHTAAIKAARREESSTAAVLASFTNLNVQEQKAAPVLSRKPPRSEQRGHSSRNCSYWRKTPVTAGHHITAPTAAVQTSTLLLKRQQRDLYTPPKFTRSTEQKTEHGNQDQSSGLNLTRRTVQ